MRSTKPPLPLITAMAMVAFTLIACEKSETVSVVPSGPPLTGAAAGEFLYHQKCATCHDLGDRKKVGPGLQGATNRHSEEWLATWIGDPQGTWEGNDPETVAMKKSFGKTDTPLTAMKDRSLSPVEIEQLIAFLKKNDASVAMPPVGVEGS